MDVYEIVGYMAGIMTAVCFLPQTIKTLKTRQTKDISFWSYLIYSFGLACWIIYGSYLDSVQMVVFNSVSLIFSLAILSIIISNLLKK